MYRKVNDCFKLSDKIRAQHELFADFQKERTDTKKFTFYLWLQKNELKAHYGKDHNGDFGYGLEFVPNEKNEEVPCNNCQGGGCPVCGGGGLLYVWNKIIVKK